MEERILCRRKKGDGSHLAVVCSSPGEEQLFTTAQELLLSYSVWPEPSSLLFFENSHSALCGLVRLGRNRFFTVTLRKYKSCFKAGRMVLLLLEAA